MGPFCHKAVYCTCQLGQQITHAHNAIGGVFNREKVFDCGVACQAQHSQFASKTEAHNNVLMVGGMFENVPVFPRGSSETFERRPPGIVHI